MQKRPAKASMPASGVTVPFKKPCVSSQQIIITRITRALQTTAEPRAPDAGRLRSDSEQQRHALVIKPAYIIDEHPDHIVMHHQVIPQKCNHAIHEEINP